MGWSGELGRFFGPERQLGGYTDYPGKYFEEKVVPLVWKKDEREVELGFRKLGTNFTSFAVSPDGRSLLIDCESPTGSHPFETSFTIFSGKHRQRYFSSQFFAIPSKRNSVNYVGIWPYLSTDGKFVLVRAGLYMPQYGNKLSVAEPVHVDSFMAVAEEAAKDKKKCIWDVNGSHSEDDKFRVASGATFFRKRIEGHVTEDPRGRDFFVWE